MKVIELANIVDPGKVAHYELPHGSTLFVICYLNSKYDITLTKLFFEISQT